MRPTPMKMPFNGEDHGQDGDKGKQCAIGQGGSLVGQAVLGEAGDAEVNGLDDGIDGEGGLVHLVLRDAPDIIGKELPESCDFLVHSRDTYKNKKSSWPVSRVLYLVRGDKVSAIYLSRMSPYAL